jgi:hypothetical protein
MLLNMALTLATRMGYSDELVNYFKQKSAYKDVIPCRHFLQSLVVSLVCLLEKIGRTH